MSVLQILEQATSYVSLLSFSFSRKFQCTFMVYQLVKQLPFIKHSKNQI